MPAPNAKLPAVRAAPELKLCVPALKLMRPGPDVPNVPVCVPPPARLSVPAATLTLPVLLKIALIVLLSVLFSASVPGLLKVPPDQLLQASVLMVKAPWLV